MQRYLQSASHVELQHFPSELPAVMQQQKHQHA